MINLRKLKDKRGLSPIFAVLILIAITVIAAIVVYMYSSGYLASMMGWGTAGQEKVAVQAVVIGDTGKLTLVVTNSGTTDVSIVSVIIRDAQGNAKYTHTFATAVAIEAGKVDDANVNFTPSSSLPSGTYTAAVVTAQGNQFVSGSFKIS